MQEGSHIDVEMLTFTRSNIHTIIRSNFDPSMHSFVTYPPKRQTHQREKESVRATESAERERLSDRERERERKRERVRERERERRPESHHCRASLFWARSGMGV
jgi:hypothetical protein